MQQIGFIGLGVMGEPMCRNLAKKTGMKVVAFDRDAQPLERLVVDGVKTAANARATVIGSDVIFLSLPSGEIVHQICQGPEGLLACIQPGQIVVDLSTSPVETTKKLGAEFEKKGAKFIDAPVARTRAAAESGTLSVMVGADAATFDTVKPLIATFASDITHCGPVGTGQVVKILNNMVVFETTVAISEAKLIGERSGVDPALLFDTLSKGSADSFVLRNHGMKSVMTGDFPERAFSVEYARKDLNYALQLAQSTGVDARGAKVVSGWFEEAIEKGDGQKYHPVISRWMTTS